MTSPMLFNIFIEDLLTRLNINSNHVLVYADDIAVVSIDREHLKETITQYEGWCRETNMVVNKTKSGIIFLGKTKKNKVMSEIDGYPIVESDKYNWV